MTRDEAIGAVISTLDELSEPKSARVTECYRSWAEGVIKPLEALGLIKFDEPKAAKADTVMVTVDSQELIDDGRGGFSAPIHVTHLVRAINSFGFEVRDQRGRIARTVEGPSEG